MHSSKNQLSKIQTKTSEPENAPFTITLMMTLFILLNQESRILEFHKAFSLKDISSHSLMIIPNITLGKIWMLESTSMSMREFLESSTVMISQEDSSQMKEFLSMLLKVTQKTFLLKLELWSISSKLHLIKLKWKITSK